MRSFIFRQSRTLPYPGREAATIFIIDNARHAFRYRRALVQHMGWPGYLKLLLKSMGQRRIFYFSQQRGQITACGTIALGFCNHYRVSPDSAVLGSIWTDPHCRGQGLATKGLRAAMNHMLRRGITTFYIDTQTSNTAMLKAIDKTGFGKPVGNFSA